MYKIGTSKELKRKSLKTCFLGFSNYDNGLLIQKYYSNILPKHKLNGTNYELDYDQIKILNEKEFINSFLKYDEVKLGKYMSKKYSELPTNYIINLVIGIMGIFKVNFNYAIYLACLNHEFYINNNELKSYVLSLHYYYSLIDNTLFKLGIKGEILYDDLNVKAQSLRNYTKLDVQLRKYK